MSFGVFLTGVILAWVIWRLIPGHQVPLLEDGWVRIAPQARHELLYVLLGGLCLPLGRSVRWHSSGPTFRP